MAADEANHFGLDRPAEILRVVLKSARTNPSPPGGPGRT
jgi:hypothetical protein